METKLKQEEDMILDLQIVKEEYVVQTVPPPDVIAIPIPGTSMGTKQFRCSKCPQTFMWKPQLASHMKEHFVRTFLTCKICRKTFHEPKDLAQHSNIVHGRFQCRTCGWRFRECKDVWPHVLSVHFGVERREEGRVCRKCGVKFETKAEWRRHKKAHPMKLFQCKLCDKEFAYNKYRNLQCHMYFAHRMGRRPKGLAKKENSPECVWYTQIDQTPQDPKAVGVMQCERCGDTFTERKYFKYHFMTVHQKISGFNFTGLEFTCNICSKTFFHQDQYGEHMTTHMNIDKPFGCETCGKAYKLQRSLKRHQRKTHTEQNGQDVSVPSVQCEFCKKFFKRPANLSTHCQKFHADRLQVLQVKQEDDLIDLTQIKEENRDEEN